MDFIAFLDSIKASADYEGQIVHIESIPEREAQYGELHNPLPAPLQEVLPQLGILQLYTHQVSAIEALRSGRNIIVETGTASGKTLCYNLPVLAALLTQAHATALYLFPTKALSQDQLRAVRAFAEANADINAKLTAATYDGDTPQARRPQIRNEANLLLTNPDMLHLAILPHHSRWRRFLANLRYIVLDEIHTYRGVFGSNVANVLRRLTRICAYYGASPQFICCSATIANPLELAQKLTNQKMRLIKDDGAPKGMKYAVLWNPPYIEEAKAYRRSPNIEAQRLMGRLIKEKVTTITFTRTRVIAELIYRYVRDFLRQEQPSLAGSIRAYRGGYRPEERREIERLLFRGQLLGVTSTTALELGIDVGSLDACLIVGFPGTFASFWQQAGRAGRKSEESLIVFIASNEPVEQYLLRHPEYLFGQSPESAVIDPENVYVLVNHLRCATHEIPLRQEDETLFGELMPPLLDALCEFDEVTKVGNKWYWGSTVYPASESDLRAISKDFYDIADISQDNLIIGRVDVVNGFAVVYPGAIYMHGAETYLVRNLDVAKRVAYVEPAEADYYTVPTFSERITIATRKESQEWNACGVELGKIMVTRRTLGFTRIQFYTLQNLGSERLDLPEQNLETIALWIIPPTNLLSKLKYEKKKKANEALEGIKNVLVSVFPHYMMADRQSVRGKVQAVSAKNGGREARADELSVDVIATEINGEDVRKGNFLRSGQLAIFLYDAHPGGLGFADKGYAMLPRMMEYVYKIISECECADGCPSCVRLPGMLPWNRTNPDKNAALLMLDDLLKR